MPEIDQRVELNPCAQLGLTAAEERLAERVNAELSTLSSLPDFGAFSMKAIRQQLGEALGVEDMEAHRGLVKELVLRFVTDDSEGGDAHRRRPEGTGDNPASGDAESDQRATSAAAERRAAQERRKRQRLRRQRRGGRRGEEDDDQALAIGPLLRCGGSA